MRKSRTPSPGWRSESSETAPWTPQEVHSSSSAILRCRYALEPVVTWNLREQDDQGGLAVALLRKWHSHFGAGSGQAVYDARKFGRELAVAWHCNSLIVDGIAAASCSLAGDLLPYVFQLVESDPGVTVSDLLGGDEPVKQAPELTEEQQREFEMYDFHLDQKLSQQRTNTQVMKPAPYQPAPYQPAPYQLAPMPSFDEDEDFDLFNQMLSAPASQATMERQKSEMMGRQKSGKRKKGQKSVSILKPPPEQREVLEVPESEPVVKHHVTIDEEFLGEALDEEGEAEKEEDQEEEEEDEPAARDAPEMVRYRGMIVTVEQRDKMMAQQEHERQARQAVLERKQRKEELLKKKEEQNKEVATKLESMKVQIAVRVNWHLCIRDHSVKGSKVTDLESFFVAMAKNPSGFLDKADFSAGLRAVTARAHDITDKTIEVFVKAFDRTCPGGISLDELRRVWEHQEVRSAGHYASEEKRKNRLRERQTMTQDDKRKMKSGAQNVVNQIKHILRGGGRTVYGELVFSVKSFFKAIDRDGSGDVNLQELVRGLRRLDVFAPIEDIKAMVDVIDEDCSGVVEMKELKQWIKGSMVAAMVARQVRETIQCGRMVNDDVVHTPTDLFDALDVDGTGTLSAEEVRDGLRALHLTVGSRELNKFVDLLDKDGGGGITKDEFVFCIEGTAGASKRAQSRIKMSKEVMKKEKFGKSSSKKAK